MKCEEVRELLPEHLLGVLDPDAEQAMKRHLRGCAACRAELASLGEGLATFARAARVVPSRRIVVMTSAPLVAACRRECPGAIVVGAYFVLAGIGMHKLITKTAFNRKIYARMSVLQYTVMQVFLIIMLALPVKILARLLFRIKYVWVTPWFNV